MAWVNGPGVSLAHIQTPWTHEFPTNCTPEDIQKQKNMISLKMRNKSGVENMLHVNMVVLTLNS